MYLDAINNLKIIKSTKGKNDLTFREIVVEECKDSDEVIVRLKALQKDFENNPAYEFLHGLKDHMSISFLDLITDEEIRFYASDE